jgi:enoyl-CoA hydratase/carnithine racemase
MVNTIGHRRSERMLALGQLVKSEEALRIGLVDEVVPQNLVIESKFLKQIYEGSF